MPRHWHRALPRHWPAGVVVIGLILCLTSGSGPSAASGAAGPATPPTAAQRCVRTAFAELSAAQRAGQLVMTGVPIGSPGAQRTRVSVNHLGGVFLAGRSSHSAATIRAGLARLSGERTPSAKVGLLVAVDQEGGKVQSLRGGGWTTIPAATVQGGWSQATLAARTRSWAGQLRHAGVSMDLAPVADTVPAGATRINPPIGAFGRQYGSDSASASAAVATVTGSIRAARVIPVVKHFPGLGRVRFNTDTSSQAVDSVTTADDPYLQPFRAGIRAGAGVVMVSSARYPILDSDHLAVFSSAVITDLLRTRIGYQGVVMTDDVGKALAVNAVQIGQRATGFITAGGDLVLTVLPEHAPAMVQAIIRKSADDVHFRDLVNRAVLRVLALKQQFGLLTCS
jgi:beta-N-acetylhexosaminidase